MSWPTVQFFFNFFHSSILAVSAVFPILKAKNRPTAACYTTHISVSENGRTNKRPDGGQPNTLEHFVLGMCGSVLLWSVLWPVDDMWAGEASGGVMRSNGTYREVVVSVFHSSTEIEPASPNERAGMKRNLLGTADIFMGFQGTALIVHITFMHQRVNSWSMLVFYKVLLVSEKDRVLAFIPWYPNFKWKLHNDVTSNILCISFLSKFPGKQMTWKHRRRLFELKQK